VTPVVPPTSKPSGSDCRSASVAAAVTADGALECIERGIGLVQQQKYLSTFLSRKAELLHAAGDDGATAVLKDAIARCEELKFRDELQQRLDDWIAAGPSA